MRVRFIRNNFRRLYASTFGGIAGVRRGGRGNKSVSVRHRHQKIRTGRIEAAVLAAPARRAAADEQPAQQPDHRLCSIATRVAAASASRRALRRSASSLARFALALKISRSSFRGATDLGLARDRRLASKSATADLDGGEPGIHNHRRGLSPRSRGSRRARTSASANDLRPAARRSPEIAAARTRARAPPRPAA
jgi:hypothetical protein